MICITLECHQDNTLCFSLLGIAEWIKGSQIRLVKGLSETPVSYGVGVRFNLPTSTWSFLIRAAITMHLCHGDG